MEGLQNCGNTAGRRTTFKGREKGECVQRGKNWRTARRDILFNEHMTELGSSFKKHMSEFVTGAFAFVAALVWRDAIQDSVLSLRELLPHVSPWILNYAMAIIVTVISVLGIIAVNKLLKIKEKDK